eukprot:6172553-Pleurochrysis_carterae.AAC.1
MRALAKLPYALPHGITPPIHQLCGSKANFEARARASPWSARASCAGAWPRCQGSRRAIVAASSAPSAARTT